MIEFYDYPENTDAEILAKAQFFKKFTLGLSERMQALGENAGPAEEEIYENNLRLIIAFLKRHVFLKRSHIYIMGNLLYHQLNK